MPVTTRSRTRPRRPVHYVYPDSPLGEEEEEEVHIKEEVEEEEGGGKDETWVEESITCLSRSERMRLRPWLEQQVNNGHHAGLEWLDKKNKVVKIPWKHASRHGWRLGDACLFQQWAMHSGKYRPGMTPNSKRWKANFRCALNSLPDIKEIKAYSQKRGDNAFKVYQLMPLKKGDRKKICDFQDSAPQLDKSDLNKLPLTVAYLEERMKKEEEEESTAEVKFSKETKIKGKRRERRLCDQNCRQKVNENLVQDIPEGGDQTVPDLQDPYYCPELRDHHHYTAGNNQDQIKKECQVYVPQGFQYQMSAYGSPLGSSVTDDGDGSTEVMTDTELVEMLDNMDYNTSDTSNVRNLPSATSESETYEWLTNSPKTYASAPYSYVFHYHHHHVAAPGTTNYYPQYYHYWPYYGKSGEDWTEQDAPNYPPFLNGFHDDSIMPCVTEPVPVFGGSDGSYSSSPSAWSHSEAEFVNL